MKRKEKKIFVLIMSQLIRFASQTSLRYTVVGCKAFMDFHDFHDL